MPETGIVLDQHEGLARLTLVNPSRRNALTVGMMHQLIEALESVDADPTVRTVVFQGADGTFCSGMDITSLGSDDLGSGDDGPAPEALAAQLEQAVLALGHPTIALVEGYAMGAGCQLASACDFRILVSGGKMGVPPARLGLVYPPSSLQRLSDLIGDTAVRRLLFTAAPIDHHQAARLGWAEVAADYPEAERMVRDFAHRVRDSSGLTIRATKDLLHGLATGADPEQRFRDWETRRLLLGETAEGVRAFAEKRAPLFPSRTQVDGVDGGRP